MTNFILNEGSTAHRGVWHVTDDLEVNSYPAVTDVRTFERYGGAIPSFYPVGTQKVMDAKCAYVEARGLPICHQAGLLRSGRRETSYGHNRLNEHGEYIVKTRALPAYYAISPEHAPMPLCTRCAKKAGIDWTGVLLDGS
jgi:hypothetical protein